ELGEVALKVADLLDREHRPATVQEQDVDRAAVDAAVVVEPGTDRDGVDAGAGAIQVAQTVDRRAEIVDVVERGAREVDGIADLLDREHRPATVQEQDVDRSTIAAAVIVP